MSLPSFSDIGSPFSREESINQMIASMAMEELALSHIMNAEGEKLQFVLGTLSGAAGPEPPATIDDVLKVNQSVISVLQTASDTQCSMKSKLQVLLNAESMAGPQGPTGPTERQIYAPDICLKYGERFFR